MRWARPPLAAPPPDEAAVCRGSLGAWAWAAAWRRLGRRQLGVERRGRRRLGRSRLCGLLLGHQVLDVGVDAVQRCLSWWARAVAWLGLAVRLFLVSVACDCCCWSAFCVAWSWSCAVWRLSMVVVTLPVAIDEYSERMPLVLTLDENIWVTWLVVPLLV